MLDAPSPTVCGVIFALLHHGSFHVSAIAKHPSTCVEDSPLQQNILSLVCPSKTSFDIIIFPKKIEITLQPIFLPIYPSIHPSHTHPPIHLPIYSSIQVSHSSSTHLFTPHLPLYAFVYPCTHLSIHITLMHTQLFISLHNHLPMKSPIYLLTHHPSMYAFVTAIYSVIYVI